MTTREELIDGNWITTYFADEDKCEEFVPSWLESKLGRGIFGPNLYSWADNLAFEMGVGLAPHIKNPEEFEVFRDLFNSFNNEGSRLIDEMNAAVDTYAEWLKQAYLQQIAQHRAEEERKSRCVLCLVSKRQPGYDLCITCRKEHWQEEQRIKIHLYRARKAGTPATLTLGQWITALKRYHYLCAYCQTNPYEVLEHYIPLSSGGGSTEENCVPACKSCNSKKRNEHPEQEGTSSQKLFVINALHDRSSEKETSPQLPKEATEHNIPTQTKQEEKEIENIHFGFAEGYGDDVCYGSYHVDLPAAITLSLIDQVLLELWGECNFGPEYLFLTEEDHKTISQEILEEAGRSPENGKDVQSHYLNQNTNTFIRLVTTPGLKSRRIILGFFK